MSNIDVNTVIELIIASGAELPESATIDASTRFDSLDLDSLDMFGLFTEIDDRYDLVVSDDDIDKFIVFEDVITFLNESLNK